VFVYAVCIGYVYVCVCMVCTYGVYGLQSGGSWQRFDPLSTPHETSESEEDLDFTHFRKLHQLNMRKFAQVRQEGMKE